ncbi:MAG TPA: hypothetical protein VFA76_10020 [Terriglobales bacterium]|nr:hypothetical protein [Terriglobales bacterium]
MSKDTTSPPRRKMVRWYDPVQLLHTGVEVIVSAVLGTRSDYRVMESFSGPQDVFDYSGEREIWIDYVADLGDGWNSTHTIATLLAKDLLDVPAPQQESSKPGSPRQESPPVRTSRGRILIMGGDEVYPVASRDGYQERTVAPYKSALPRTEPPHPVIFAIPGNHDWYDGLVSFTRLFCQHRWIAGWQTRQKRSYFALKLPAGWWLWGVDLQLESDIDQPQLEYFCEVAKKMSPGDQVILATAEPDWIYGNIYDPKLGKNIAFLEKNVIRELASARLMVALAGDLHHYRRHESLDGARTQLITSGGGGAFLHPTYGSDVSELKVGKEPVTRYALKSEYPDQKTSKRLLWRDWLFPFYNPTFGLLTGAVYLAIAWIYREPVLRELGWLAPNPPKLAMAEAFVRALVGSPAGFFWMFAVIVVFWAFTDTHKPAYRYVAGTVHALSHLAGIIVASWVAIRITTDFAGFAAGSLKGILLDAILIFAVGYVWGAMLMGIYLFVSLRFFRRHANEAFSALHIADYKNFLRMHIDPSGTLTIFPIGVDKIPTRWDGQARSSSLPPHIDPKLIESPIRVTR